MQRSQVLFPQFSIVDSKTVQRSALCRPRRELSNEYLFAKIGFNTAENEPCKVCPLSANRSPRSLINRIPRSTCLRSKSQTQKKFLRVAFEFAFFSALTLDRAIVRTVLLQKLFIFVLLRTYLFVFSQLAKQGGPEDLGCAAGFEATAAACEDLKGFCMRA